MRVTGNPETTGAGGNVPDTAQTKPQTTFSEVLKEEQRTSEHPSRDRGERKPAEPEKRTNGESPMPGDVIPGALAFASPLPFRDAAPIDAGQGTTAGREALVASLVQEIAVQAPPGGEAAVDI